ncbi:MAG: hypothetical protein KDD64_10720, partial [Bdellovibrionales bacterium]|nr:hypothetical protein [Bdellovibrionales bacterium]
SKDDLIEEVFRRRIEQVNQVRLSELSNLRARFGDSQIPVADLLRAFLSPVLRIGRARDRGNNFFRLVARAHAEPSELVQRVLYSQLKEIVQIFLSELHRSLPHLTQNELSLRLAFTAGAMVQAVLMPMNMVFGKELITDEEKLVDQLVAFGVGGMMSECPRKQK